MLITENLLFTRNVTEIIFRLAATNWLLLDVFSQLAMLGYSACYMMHASNWLLYAATMRDWRTDSKALALRLLRYRNPLHSTEPPAVTVRRGSGTRFATPITTKHAVVRTVNCANGLPLHQWNLMSNCFGPTRATNAVEQIDALHAQLGFEGVTTCGSLSSSEAGTSNSREQWVGLKSFEHINLPPIAN